MHFSTIAVAALATVAQAVDVQVVAVGQNPADGKPGLKFYPSNIKAAAGTMVQFQFWAGNHTVTQSDFDHPCVPIGTATKGAEGIFSGFQPAAASQAKGEIPVFTIKVNDTKPIWLFCSQGPHCENGMAMVINENTGANSTRSLTNYIAAAAKAKPGSDSAPQGSSNGGATSAVSESAPASTATGAAPPPYGSSTPTTGSSDASGTGSLTVPTSAKPTTAGAPALGVSSSLLLALGAAFALL